MYTGCCAFKNWKAHNIYHNYTDIIKTARNTVRWILEAAVIYKEQTPTHTLSDNKQTSDKYATDSV